MAGRSVHAAIVNRDQQCRNLFFAERQPLGFLINSPLKVEEQTGHRGGQTRQPDRIRRTAGVHVARPAVQLLNGSLTPPSDSVSIHVVHVMSFPPFYDFLNNPPGNIQWLIYKSPDRNCATDISLLPHTGSILKKCVPGC